MEIGKIGLSQNVSRQEKRLVGMIMSSSVEIWLLARH